jgi:hypothetical protein
MSSNTTQAPLEEQGTHARQYSRAHGYMNPTRPDDTAGALFPELNDQFSDPIS